MDQKKPECITTHVPHDLKVKAASIARMEGTDLSGLVRGLLEAKVDEFEGKYRELRQIFEGTERTMGTAGTLGTDGSVPPDR